MPRTVEIASNQCDLRCASAKSAKFSDDENSVDRYRAFDHELAGIGCDGNTRLTPQHRDINPMVDWWANSGILEGPPSLAPAARAKRGGDMVASCTGRRGRDVRTPIKDRSPALRQHAGPGISRLAFGPPLRAPGSRRAFAPLEAGRDVCLNRNV
jgi:hypothetical protein